MPETATPITDSVTLTRFTLIIHDTGQAAALAQRFARSVLAAGHSIEQIFFYHDAVFEADANRAPAQDDPQLPQSWTELAESAGDVPLNVCIAAGNRRGVLNASEAERHDKAAANLLSPFQLVGLGVLVEGLMNADRVVTFAN